MKEYFASNLKYLREKKNMNQIELAEELNIPPSTLCCWETGVRTPKIAKVQEIADYFHVGMDIVSRNFEDMEDLYISSIKADSEIEEVLFSKAKELSDSDKQVVISVIDSIKRNKDKED